MVLAVNQIGDNPQTPGISAQTYEPDQLVAGNLKLITENVTLSAGTLLRGTILGQKTLGSAIATAEGSNIGNGTSSVVAVEDNVQEGDYQLIALSATDFEVIAPNGDRLEELTVGTAYADQIGLTITAGATAFVAGDTFTVAVSAGDGSYIESVATATDGSQIPSAVLADDADASAGAVVAPAYIMGEFNESRITYDASWSLVTLKTALRRFNIYLKSVVSSLDPT